MFFELPNYNHYISMMSYAKNNDEIIEWFHLFKHEYEKNVNEYSNDSDALEYLYSEYEKIVEAYHIEYQNSGSDIKLVIKMLFE